MGDTQASFDGVGSPQGGVLPLARIGVWHERRADDSDLCLVGEIGLILCFRRRYRCRLQRANRTRNREAEQRDGRQ